MFKRWWHRFKTTRIDIVLVPYAEADNLLNDGWELALPEEDTNNLFGMVYIEKREVKK